MAQNTHSYTLQHCLTMKKSFALERDACHKQANTNRFQKNLIPITLAKLYDVAG